MKMLHLSKSKKVWPFFVVFVLKSTHIYLLYFPAALNSPSSQDELQVCPPQSRQTSMSGYKTFYITIIYMLFRQCQNIYYHQYMFHRYVFLIQQLQIWLPTTPLSLLVIVCTFVAAQFQSKASNANYAACLKVCFATFQLFSISNTSVVKLCFSDIHCNAGCFRSAQHCSKNVNRKHGISNWVQ